MCTIFKYKNCVGRNFDYEKSYKEQMVIFDKDEYHNKYAIIGICAGIESDYPLLYDGMNEHGLCVGGLAFSDFADYKDCLLSSDKFCIPAYDFTLHMLGNCKNVQEAMDLLNNVQITNTQYKDIPNSDLHWFIADEKQSIIVEQIKDGLFYEPADVMTNNPPYPLQYDMYHNLRQYIGRGSNINTLKTITRGVETMNLDGSYTSMGRFERVSFLKEQLDNIENDKYVVENSFHLLSSAEQIYGVTKVGEDFEYTIYSVVYDMKEKTMTIKTYKNLELKYYQLNLNQNYREIL